MKTTDLADRMFAPGFVWGAATSAYQIEGARDLRADSIWDLFAAKSGKVHRGDTGTVACDHYHRWRDDLDLMASLGLTAYRFSVAWPRVLPDGTGAVDQRGLDFYRKLVDGLLERGITPSLTLYHWDLPVALHDKGGWLSPRTVEAFGEYTGVLLDALGDRVPLWTTINEPWVPGMLGYGTLACAPGVGEGPAALRASHNLLLAHGNAMQLLRGHGRSAGIVVNLSPIVPASQSSEDAAAAQRFDGYLNRWFLDALLRGEYPQDMIDWYGSALDGVVRDGDFAAISTPMDVLGVNYYSRMYVAAGDDPATHLAQRPALDAHTIVPPVVPTTALDWPIEPDGLYEMLGRLRDEYSRLPPIYITENGAAYDDYLDPENGVDDDERIDYLSGHLGALHEAIAEGVDVRGYFCWSLLDNFEWSHGYSKRFGLVHVDFGSQRRTPKASAAWYRDVIARNGLP